MIRSLINRSNWISEKLWLLRSRPNCDSKMLRLPRSRPNCDSKKLWTASSRIRFRSSSKRWLWPPGPFRWGKTFLSLTTSMTCSKPTSGGQKWLAMKTPSGKSSSSLSLMLRMRVMAGGSSCSQARELTRQRMMALSLLIGPKSAPYQLHTRRLHIWWVFRLKI